MSSRHPEIDLSGVRRYPWATRRNLVRREDIVAPPTPATAGAILAAAPQLAAALTPLAAAIRAARAAERPVIFACGGHVIKVGMSRIAAALVRAGWFTALATNGAGMIHDYELARFGATSEDVAETLHSGDFGFALETGRELNALTARAAREQRGLGETVGEALRDQEASLLGAAAAAGIPATVHLAIGTDIIHPHPDFDGGAAGEASARDFRILAAVVANLAPGGVFISAGSAVIIPEVFLKAVTLAVNLGHSMRAINTAVLDQLRHYRPTKNILERPTLDGGKSWAIEGRHEATLPVLAALLLPG